MAEFRTWTELLLPPADEVLGRSLAITRPVFRGVLLSARDQRPNGKLSETAAKSQFLIADTYFWEKNYKPRSKSI